MEKPEPLYLETFSGVPELEYVVSRVNLVPELITRKNPDGTIKAFYKERLKARIAELKDEYRRIEYLKSRQPGKMGIAYESGDGC